VPALFWGQLFSGASIAPVSALHQHWAFASLISKVLVSANSWCQQSPGVSKGVSKALRSHLLSNTCS
jgi:hypothetical protein